MIQSSFLQDIICCVKVLDKTMRLRFSLLLFLCVSAVTATFFLFIPGKYFERDSRVPGPYQRNYVEKPIVSARAFVVVGVSPEGKSRVLIGRAIERELPIASVTKLF